MIYSRMLITIIIVVSLVQFITCVGAISTSSPQGQPSTRNDTLSKNKTSVRPPGELARPIRAPTQGRRLLQPVGATARPIRTPAQSTTAPAQLAEKPAGPIRAPARPVRAPTQSRGLTPPPTTKQTQPKAPTQGRELTPQLTTLPTQPKAPTQGRGLTPQLTTLPPQPKVPTQGRGLTPQPTTLPPQLKSPTKTTAPIQGRGLTPQPTTLPPQLKAPTKTTAPIQGRGLTPQPTTVPTQPKAPNNTMAPATQGSGFNKDGRFAGTNPPTRSRTPPIRRTPSSTRALPDDSNKPNALPQVNGKYRKIQPPEENIDSYETDEVEDKGTDNQSKLLMPVRAIKRTGGFLFKSARNTLARFH